MARIAKPAIRKIASSPKASKRLHALKPDPSISVANPGAIDASTQKAINTEEAILFSTKSIFPLDLIPNELIVKEKSVTIVWNYAINSNVQTMLLKDIGYVTINDNKIIAALVISYKSPLENIEIKNLKPQDAYEAKSLIEKLMIQLSEGGVEKKQEDDSTYL